MIMITIANYSLQATATIQCETERQCNISNSYLFVCVIFDNLSKAKFKLPAPYNPSFAPLIVLMKTPNINSFYSN